MKKFPNLNDVNRQLDANRLPTIKPTRVATLLDDRVDGRMLLGAGIGGMNGVLLSRLFKLKSTGALTMGVLGAILGGYVADKYGVKKTASIWPALGMGSVVPGAMLLGKGVIAAKLHAGYKAVDRLLNTDRVETRKAIATALRDVKGTPKHTWIATNPAEAAKFGFLNCSDPADYWMLPWKLQNGERAAYVNTPAARDGTLNITALKHELGHAVDHNVRDIARVPPLKHRLLDTLIGAITPRHTYTVDKEVRAWDYSGVPGTDKTRRAALKTYTLDARTKLLSELADLAARA